MRELCILVTAGFVLVSCGEKEKTPEVTQALCEAITNVEECETSGCTPICGYILKEYSGSTTHCIERRRASKCVAAVPYDWDQENNQEMFGVVFANSSAWVRNEVAGSLDGGVVWHEHFLMDNTAKDYAVVILGYDQQYETEAQDPCSDPNATVFPWQGTCDTWWSDDMWDEYLPEDVIRP